MCLRRSRLTIESDTDLSTISLLEFLPVNLHRRSVGHENIVTDNPALATAVSLWALRTVTGPAGRKQTGVEPQDGAAPWLVEGDPMLHLGAKGLKDYTGIIRVVRYKLFLVEHAPIPLLQLIGKVPVEKRD